MNKIQQYYDNYPEYEWDRLERCRMEYEITMLVLQEYLPKPPLKILDIGGGPGRYSIALAKKGYDVTLVDMSKNCLDFAREQASKAGIELSAYIHSNALDLSQIERQCCDAVLLMGPLYHLLTIEERQKALLETNNILKPGGYIFAAFITRYAQFLYSAGYEPTWIVDNPEECKTLLSNGIIKPKGGQFTDAYCAHPSEIIPFMENANFETLDMVGCEGITYCVEEKIDKLASPVWKEWVKLNYQLGKEPSLYGAAAHLLYIGKKA